jgi:hypothetical protein
LRRLDSSRDEQFFVSIKNISKDKEGIKSDQRTIEKKEDK